MAKRINPGLGIDHRMTPAQLIRFLSKVIRARNHCWNWIAYHDEKGYGQFCWEGKVHWAHRVSYATFKSFIPAGWEVHHECGNPGCVNPDHLSLLTHGENSADANRRRGTTN